MAAVFVEDPGADAVATVIAEGRIVTAPSTVESGNGPILSLQVRNPSVLRVELGVLIGPYRTFPGYSVPPCS